MAGYGGSVSAFESDDAVAVRNQQQEDSLRKLVDQEKQRFELMQQEAKLQDDFWRDQQDASDRCYRQLMTAELQYQRILAGRAQFYTGQSAAPPSGANVTTAPPGMQAPITPAPGLSAPALPAPAGLGGSAAGIADAVKPYLQTAAASFAIPTTALGAFAVAINESKKAIEAYNQGFTVNGFNQGRADDARIRGNMMFEWGGGLDTTRNQQRTQFSLLHNTWGSWINGNKPEEGYDANTTYRKQGFDRQEAAYDRAERESTAGLTMQKDDALRNLQRQESEMQPRMRFGSNDNSALFQIQGNFTADKERALAGAGKTFGYGRQAEQEDISRRYATEESLARSGAESQRRKAILEAQGPTNQKNIAGLQEKLEGNRTWLAGQQGKLDRALKTNYPLEANLLRQGMIAGRDEESKNEQQLAQERGKELERQNGLMEINNNLSKERANALTSERNALSSNIQQERNRKQGMKEQFGLMLPHERGAAVKVARDFAGGKQLDRQSLEFAKGHSDLYKTQLAQLGDKLAGPQWEEMKKLTGQDEREGQLSKERMELDNKIAVNINGLDKNLAQQILEKLMPSLATMQAEVIQKFKTEMDKREHERQAGRVAPLG